MDRRLAVAVLLTALLPACAARQKNAHQRTAGAACDVVIVNFSAHSLDIRVHTDGADLASIGTINPGELLTHRPACAQRTLLVVGSPLSSQVGAAVSFPYLVEEVGLVRGEVQRVVLHYPSSRPWRRLFN